MSGIQNKEESRSRQRGKKPMKKEREHPLVIVLTIVIWLGYGGIKDLYTVLLPFIVDEPVRSASILLNIILLSYLFNDKDNKKKTRGAGL
jgi:hypothetical protein